MTQTMTAAEYRKTMGGVLLPAMSMSEGGDVKARQKGGSARNLGVSEHVEQVRLIEICRKHEIQYPELSLIYAVPNGGQRNVLVAKKLKAEGVRAGVPDLCLPVARGGFHGLYVEMKAAKGRVQDSQREMLSALEAQGYKCEVCYGAAEAWAVIEEYLNLPERV